MKARTSLFTVTAVVVASAAWATTDGPVISGTSPATSAAAGALSASAAEAEDPVVALSHRLDELSVNPDNDQVRHAVLKLLGTDCRNIMAALSRHTTDSCLLLKAYLPLAALENRLADGLEYFPKPANSGEFGMGHANYLVLEEAALTLKFILEVSGTD